MAAMRIRILIGVLLAVAMSFAPLAMGAGQAMAAAPEHHVAMDLGQAHCPDQPDEPGQPDGKACCAGGCMAAAALPAAIVDPSAPPRPLLLSPAEQFRRGTLSEIATPPPRPS